MLKNNLPQSLQPKPIKTLIPETALAFHIDLTQPMLEIKYAAHWVKCYQQN